VIALLDIATRVAERAVAGEQIEAYLARSLSTDVKVFGGDIESLSSAETHGIGVRVVTGGRQGFAYAGSLDEGVIEETIAEARDNAGFGTVDEYLGLPEPGGVEATDLDLYREDMASVPASRKVDLALEAERATRAADSRIRGVETASYGDSAYEGAIASSLGVRAAWRRTVCSLYASALAGDGGETQTGYGYSVARHPDDLDIAKVVGEASERATRLLGATKPPSRRLTVLFDRHVTPSFLRVLASALNADSVLKGRSLFADRMGEAVAAPVVTLVDDPTDARAYGASSHDSEGLACRPNNLIRDGVMSGLLHDSYTARRVGALSNGCAVRGGFKSTPGPGSRALALTPGGRNQEELLADHADGLLVVGVSGLHSGVNPVSGDFSVGVEGLMVRDGSLAEPVREATVASTLPAMLLGIVAVGSDVEWLPGGAAGVTLVLSDLSLSGI